MSNGGVFRIPTKASKKYILDLLFKLPLQWSDLHSSWEQLRVAKLQVAKIELKFPEKFHFWRNEPFNHLDGFSLNLSKENCISKFHWKSTTWPFQILTVAICNNNDDNNEM